MSARKEFQNFRWKEVTKGAIQIPGEEHCTQRGRKVQRLLEGESA